MFHHLFPYLKSTSSEKELQDRILELTQNLEEKENFLRNWNHDLGGQVNVINAALLLLKSAHEKEDFKFVIEGCMSSCQLLKDIHTNTGDFLNNKEDKVTLAPVDLQECLSTVVAAYQPLAKVKDTWIELKVNIDFSIPLVSDGIKLRRIICNLLSNAVKFTERGEQISVRAYNKEYFLYIEVQDKGIGIPAEQQAFIFMPYVKLDEQRPGLGIGLTISKTLTEQLGGKLIVASALSVGSTFTVVLPLGTPNFQSMITGRNKQQTAAAPNMDRQ